MTQLVNNKFNEEIENIRKEKLSLNRVDTDMIFDIIMDYYKKKIVNESRNIKGYTFDIAICDMNGYNKLGNISNMYQKWGDLYFVDLKNSTLIKVIINDDGDEELNETISFHNIGELNDLIELRDISFSLKELINMCEKNNFKVDLFSDDSEENITTLEITPYKHFDKDRKSINVYIDSVAIDN